MQFIGCHLSGYFIYLLIFSIRNPSVFFYIQYRFNLPFVQTQLAQILFVILDYIPVKHKILFNICFNIRFIMMSVEKMILTLHPFIY